MATTCEKQYTLEVGSIVSEYWKFDSGPPYPAEINSDLELSTISGTPSLGVGIINSAMQISGVPVNTVEGVSTNAGAGNSKIIISTGFTFTTWVNWTSFGTTTSQTDLLLIEFFDSLSAAVVNFRFLLNPGPPPVFPIVQKNAGTILSPSVTFGTGIWYFFRLQFDFSSKKVGFQRGHPIFGLSALEESAAIADDLSTITQGRITLRGATGHTISTSPDYVQDESGFWRRLLTSTEVNDLWGGGTPPTYPNVPPP